MRLCRTDALSDPGAIGVRIGEGDWPLRALVSRRGETWCAYVNRCPHAGHPLDLIPDRFLAADGSALVCSSHGAQFRLEDGFCVSGPCTGQSLQRIPVVVDGDWVCLGADFDAGQYAP